MLLRVDTHKPSSTLSNRKRANCLSQVSHEEPLDSPGRRPKFGRNQPTMLLNFFPLH